MAEMIASVPEFGASAAVWKSLILLALLPPWLYLAPWVHRDATKLFHTATMWNATVLGAGAVGVLVWLLVPYYVVGLLFYVVLAAGGLFAYVAYRNGHVEEKRKIKLLRLAAALKPKRREQFEILTKVTLYNHAEKVVMPPDMVAADADEIDTYNRAQEFLYDLVWRRASEVVLMPDGQRTRVLYVIDGVTTERPAMQHAQSDAIIQFLKGVAGLDLDERRRPQKGPLSVDFHGSRADMVMTTDGTTHGQRLMIRHIQEVVRTRLDELDMPDDVLEEIRKIGRTENGLFIVSGQRGSGVTSTLYSILRERDAFIQNVGTVEAAPAVDLENITQQPYEDDAKLPRILAAIFERGVDVLMVDNCPNTETSKLVVQAAAKRPVLLGVQANDSFVALARWVKICGDPKTAVNLLRGVMCQMLLRRLCTECKEPYRPDPRRLAKLNLPTGKIDRFYRPGKPTEDKKGEVHVCDACQGSGYRGRTAAFELLLLNKEIRELITNGATVAQIRAACRKNKMLYLQEQSLRKVIDGTTSVEEVIRATQQRKK